MQSVARQTVASIASQRVLADVIAVRTSLQALVHICPCHNNISTNQCAKERVLSR